MKSINIKQCVVNLSHRQNLVFPVFSFWHQLCSSLQPQHCMLSLHQCRSILYSVASIAGLEGDSVLSRQLTMTCAQKKVNALCLNSHR